MSDKVSLEALYDNLFSERDIQVYGVLDGASIPGLVQSLEQTGVDHVCLYRGELIPELAAAAPYLAALEKDCKFTRHVLEQGWGNHWGIFALSRADLRTLRQHFRTFLMVYGPDGKPLYFRYYDPRVLRVYLSTCNVQDTGVLFGPVSRYVMEGEEPTVLLRFWPEAGQPGSERVQLARAEDVVL